MRRQFQTLWMAIKQPETATMSSVVRPARPLVAKSPDNIVEANITLTGGALTLTGRIFRFLGPVARGNAAPDICNCPDPVPAFAIQGSVVAYLPLWGAETPRTTRFRF